MSLTDSCGWDPPEANWPEREGLGTIKLPGIDDSFSSLRVHIRKIVHKD